MTLWSTDNGTIYPSGLQLRAGPRSTTTNLWSLTTHIHHVMIIVTSGFSKKSFFIINFRGSRMQMSSKTDIIRNFAIFTGKQLCWSLFLIRLQALWPATLYQPCPKRDNCENFRHNLFYGTPLGAAFVSLIK